MKYFVVFALVCSVGVVLSAPQGDPNGVSIVRFINDLQEDGGYKFSYELSDGQLRNEAGIQKEVGEEKPIVVSGVYSFVAPDGQTYWVTYTADENGFHPVVGTGAGGPAGGDAGIDPNALKSLIGK